MPCMASDVSCLSPFYIPTQEYSVNALLALGAPANKVVLGVPFYGRSFTLSDPAQNGIGAPVKGAGAAGAITKESGSLSYYEVRLLNLAPSDGCHGPPELSAGRYRHAINGISRWHKNGVRRRLSSRHFITLFLHFANTRRRFVKDAFFAVRFQLVPTRLLTAVT